MRALALPSAALLLGLACAHASTDPPPPAPAPKPWPQAVRPGDVRLGCEVVPRALLDTRGEVVRARLWARVQKRLGVSVADREVEEVLARRPSELGLTEKEFADALAAQGTTADPLRATVRKQLLEFRVISALRLLDGVPDWGSEVAAAFTALFARMRERLERVPLFEDEGRCFEQWPSYALGELELKGLVRLEESAVRAELAKVLAGRVVTMDDVATLPPQLDAAVAAAGKAAGLEAHIASWDEGPKTLVLTIAEAPPAAR